MKNVVNKGTSRDVFEPIHTDLLDTLSSQADIIAAQRRLRERMLADQPVARSGWGRTTATLLRVQTYHAPLSSFVNILQRSAR